MELIGILFAAVLFPVAIAIWLVLSSRFQIRPWIRFAGVVVILLPAALGGLSMARWCFIEEPLYGVACDGDVVGVQRYLRLGANPNMDFEGFSPLYAAAECGHKEVIRILIAHGADVNFHTGSNDTPRKVARRNGHADIDRMLVAAGAKE